MLSRFFIIKLTFLFKNSHKHDTSFGLVLFFFWELSFIWWTYWGLQACGQAAFQITWTNCSEEARQGSQDILEFYYLQRRADSRNKKLLLIKENWISQVKEFSTFLCMGRCKSLGSPRYTFDMHLSYLEPKSCVFTFWISSGFTIWSGCSLKAARWPVFFIF